MQKLFRNQNVASLMKFLKPALSAVLILIVLHFSGFLNAISPTAEQQLRSSLDYESAPEKTFDYDFSIKSMDGKAIDMNVYKGKVIFLNMWATWCGPCRHEMPSIQELYNKVDKEKVEFIMLSLDTEENQPKIVKYIQEKGFTFSAYQPAGFVPKQLQVSTIPTTFIISADGKIKVKKVGTTDYNTAEYLDLLTNLATSPTPN
jgi:thiol-disulfide isomerase/thioredoxin